MLDTAAETGSGAAPADRDAALEHLKATLGERVAEVRVSSRLTESPACLVLAEHALGPQMRKILAASGQEIPEAKPVLEVNPGHPLVVRIGSETDDERRDDLACLLYDQAALAAGEALEDPAGFVRRLNRLLLAG